MPTTPPLSFAEKSAINRKLIDAFSLSLFDKETDVIAWPGKVYNEFAPYQMALAGSIGYAPKPDFEGAQAPNAMGMVLLVEPTESGDVEARVSGQFDICFRQIPDIAIQRSRLKKEGGDPKATQSIVLSYRRLTVQFEDVPLSMNINTGLNQWVTPPAANSIVKGLSDIQDMCLTDPRIFKVPELTDKGSAKFVFNWPEGGDYAIADQDEFNQTIARDIFERETDLMRHNVRLRARIRKAPVSLSDRPNAHLVEIYLENITTRDEARAFGLDSSAFLFDVRFNTKLVAGQGHLLPHKLAPKDYRYMENDGVPGYGITTSIEQIADNHYGTNAIPVSGLSRIKNPSPAELGMSSEPSFAHLSTNPVPTLKGLVAAMDAYLLEWQKQIDGMLAAGKESEAEVAMAERALLVAEKANIDDGVSLLETHPKLLQAFKWMNESMLESFKHQGKPIDQWRLFQLGFILTQVRAVYERCSPESELTDHLSTAEVLWFATGGGKTEAYMGIIVMAMFYERMYQRLYGPTAWMKFPLRMLSVQQFQRLSYAVAQANRIKVREGATLAGHPFTIGYFTGGGTPSGISSNYNNAEQYFLPKLDARSREKLQFISDCPYCNHQDSIKVVTDIPDARLKHVCENPECWSNTEMPEGTYGEGTRGELGIYVSDEEVYRYLPTVLVGTIDKLSVIGHNRRFKALLGSAPYFCPVHGFSSTTKCEHRSITRDSDGEYQSDSCPNNTKTSAVRVVPSPPGLKAGISFILQDELHLLKENTGNFDAHYESTMRALQMAQGCREPKVLSATATIKGYEDHIHHLYQKHARRFPSPGMKRGESFYSRVELGEDGKPLIQRWYAGILPIGSGRIMQRSSALASTKFLTMIDEWRAELTANPKSVCDTLGVDVSKAPVLLDYIETYLNTCLLYSNSMNDNTDIHRALDEFQEGMGRVYEHLDGNSTLDHIQGIIHHIERKRPDDPFRQVVATSVVSHGVDMHRLNFMIMAGWPKSISEYLQASARAGRVEPGVVLNVLNSKTLFQTNVFLDFQDYHLFMDRMVESVPVNRFAPNLLQKTLPGVVNAAILNWMVNHPGCGEGILKSAGNLRDALRDTTNGAADGLRTQLKESLGVPDFARAFFDHRVLAKYEMQLDKAITRVLHGLENLPSQLATARPAEALERILGNRPMRSLRDIEISVSVRVNESISEDLLEALGDR
ncbi:DEAD/DEAH box helicase [Spongiibacter taiwanensis]|uniref:DEAD/DEAH box helicase n=1 Tax=Spongiibacter taiwanensis TaxID=1748242 RepID=UPI0020354CF5|nr:DEAD/DEAH box helicase [Spongiibacter taiwanensis]USA43757.1 DEAD/DEAH box helicase [Spongiibacter taiwanensis]